MNKNQAEVATIEYLNTLIERHLIQILSQHELPFYQMMRYHLGWEPAPNQQASAIFIRRDRGIACLLACQAVYGNVEIAIPAACSVELVHNFSEIHDDVQNGHPKRDNRDAVWWIWGPAQAINAGDGMHALARLSMFQLEKHGISDSTTFKAMQMIDEAGLALCEGRFYDLESQEHMSTSVSSYIKMAAAKTGALYSYSMQLGALVASSNETVIKALGNCGTNLGIAIQIRNDLKELFQNESGGQMAGDEVLNKKKILPIVYALEIANAGQKRRLGEIYLKRILEPQDVIALRTALQEMEVSQFCEEQIVKYLRKAGSEINIDGISKEGKSNIEKFMSILASA